MNDCDATVLLNVYIYLVFYRRRILGTSAFTFATPETIVFGGLW
jgi:hypothetical protein